MRKKRKRVPMNKVTWADPWAEVWKRVRNDKSSHIGVDSTKGMFDFIDQKSPAWQTLYEAWHRYMDTIKGGPSQRTYKNGCKILAEYMLGERAIERRLHGFPDAFFHLLQMSDPDRYDYIDRWLKAMADKGLSTSSIATYLKGPRGFTNYLFQRGLAPNAIQNKIFKSIYKPSDRTERRKRPAAARQHELEKVLGVIETGEPMGARDYAMIRVLIDLGLRISELLAIKHTDFEPSQGETPGKLTITSAKTRAGAEPNIVTYDLPLPTDLAIREWLANPPAYMPKGEKVEWLFYGVAGASLGRKLTPRQMSHRLEKYCKDARITPFPLHAIRRYAGNHARRVMEELGLDKGDVMDYMRHAHWSTTEIYTQPDTSARAKLAQAVASSVLPRRLVEPCGYD